MAWPSARLGPGCMWAEGLPVITGAHVGLWRRSVLTADACLACLQAYKPGRVVTARVTGARPMDGLAVCTLKPSAIEGGALSYEDIAPGQLMSGTVDGIEDFGVFVKLAVGVKCASASFCLGRCLSRPIEVPLRCCISHISS